MATGALNFSECADWPLVWTQEPRALTFTTSAMVRSCVLRLCPTIQLQTHPVEVKEELVPLISPAATWGRKEDGKEKRKRLMYNTESALEAAGNNNSLHAPLLFILHFHL